MSTNVPRPPRPPRPGGATQPPSTSAPPPSKPTGGSDFGDTRTVILSRKSMGMMQSLKDEEAAKAAARATSGPAAAPAPVAPQLPRASVVDGIVSCVKCSASFPIVSDEYYGAQVECPDCAAEFVIPTQAELAAQARSQAPMPAPSRPAPAAAPSRPAPAAPAPAVISMSSNV